ncbi:MULTISPECIES: nucleotidyltransferase family protein [Furfurilactobacillus]|uniref:Nucleotidyltransferase n=1 Tax=Furfurilactobacillus rossiae TaxID=231049 RepID=A0A7C9MS37_9LACO|nr:nucleotidyltransferase family protein [Furfurilactobacillus milii]MYV06143.1 nucleotidyltransferase [Furfurilactobacillus milii]
MKNENEQSQQILDIIQDIPALMTILHAIADQHLIQGALAAGSIRNTVWQVLSHQPVRLSSDIDVVFFDPKRPYEDNLPIQAKLKDRLPQYKWQVKNEAYMNTHNFNDVPPFTSVADAIGHFVETPTCVGAYLDESGQLRLIAPHGVADLLNFISRPVPMYQQDAAHMAIFDQRMAAKQWQQKWPQLSILTH